MYRGKYIPFFATSQFFRAFTKYEYLILVNGTSVELIVRASYLVPKIRKKKKKEKTILHKRQYICIIHYTYTNLKCGCVEQSVSRLGHIGCMEAIVEGIILHVMIL